MCVGCPEPGRGRGAQCTYAQETGVSSSLRQRGEKGFTGGHGWDGRVDQSVHLSSEKSVFLCSDEMKKHALTSVVVSQLCF